MVVIAAAVCTKSGKALLSRQFVDISRVRIEGLLSAFPKLMGSDKEHTFIETESVRYVYQPMESLYMLVITNKTSNIMEDLDTLHLLAKLVPEYCGILDERTILEHAFNIVFAFDEVIAAGYKEKVNIQQIKTFTEMDSHEERIHEILERNKLAEAKRIAREKQKEIARERHESGMGGMGGMGGGGMSGMGGGGSIGSRAMGSGSSSSNEPYVQRSNSSSSVNNNNKPSPNSAANRAPKSGMKLGKSTKADDFLKQMEAAGELVEDRPLITASASGGSSTSAATSSKASATEAVHLVTEERIVCVTDQDGGLQSFEVKGELAFRIADPAKGRLAVKLANFDEKAFQFRVHPNINKAQFTNQKVLALKDSKRSFPAGADIEPLGVLKWRYVSSDESAIPLTVNCWPSPSSDITTVNVEYELQRQDFELHNVVIEIQIPGGHSPVVDQADGNYKYDPKAQVLRWAHPVIDSNNATGSMEFKIPCHTQPANLFPVNVTFASPTTFCAIEIEQVISLEDNQPIKYSNESQLMVDTYQVSYS